MLWASQGCGMGSWRNCALSIITEIRSRSIGNGGLSSIAFEMQFPVCDAEMQWSEGWKRTCSSCSWSWWIVHCWSLDGIARIRRQGPPDLRVHLSVLGRCPHVRLDVLLVSCRCSFWCSPTVLCDLPWTWNMNVFILRLQLIPNASSNPLAGA